MSKILEEARKCSELTFLKAKADLGDDIAEFNVGYFNATGTTPDYEKSFGIFKKYADKNVPEAFHNLGVMYLNGYGVEPNKNEANRWFEKAAENGLDYAKISLYK